MRAEASVPSPRHEVEGRGWIDAKTSQSGRLDLNRRPFGPQPRGFGCLCVSERPSFPICPGPWTIWMHGVPKRYHGAGSQSGTPVRRALRDRQAARESDRLPTAERVLLCMESSTLLRDTPAGTRQQLDGPVARLWEALPAARSGLAAALAQERVRGAGRRANLGVTSIYLQGIEAVDLELTPSHLEGGLGPEAVLRAHVFSLFPASRRRCGLLAGGSAHEIE